MSHNNITEIRSARKALEQCEEKFRAIQSALGDSISMVDRNLSILWANDFAKATFGEEIEGEKCHAAHRCSQKPCADSNCIAQLAFKDEKIHERQTECVDKSGRKKIFQCTASVALRDGKGIPDSVFIILRDITDQQTTIVDLQRKEMMLKKQARSLKEVNTALDVLLQHRAKELTQFQKNIVSKLNLGVFPHIERLKTMLKQKKQKSYLKMIEFNLRELVAPLGGKPAADLINLTPTELEISQLIKQGMTSKEIANTMNLSLNTIAFHRSNIRKKLGLMNRKSNLRSHLQSLG